MGLYKTSNDDSSNDQPARTRTRLLDGQGESQDTPRQSLFPPTGERKPGALTDLATPSTPAVRVKTRLVAPGSAPQPATAEVGPDTELATDPVVGWLVVVKGPGRGAFRPVGYQVNPIGRDPNASANRIILNFGDDTISNERHVSLIYDPESRAFYLERGDGMNLCHLNGRPVGRDLTEIPPNAKIKIGQTECVLIPFCGAHFDWSDESYPFGAPSIQQESNP